MKGAIKAVAVLGGLALAVCSLNRDAEAQRWVGEGYTDNVTMTFGDGGTGSKSATCADLSSTDGLDLTNKTGYRVVLAVPANSDAGQASLFGGEAMCCVRAPYVSGSAQYGANTSAWMRCKTSLDVTGIPEAQVRYAAPDFSVGVAAGRVMYVPNAITTDGGTFMSITVIGQNGNRVR